MSSENAPATNLIALFRRLPTLSYFQILGLPHRYASTTEIKRAFHNFAQNFHPDLYYEEEEPIREAAREVFKRAVESYEVLRDPGLQQRYVEQFLKKKHLRFPPEEFSRRAAIAAGGSSSITPPSLPQEPLRPRSWIDDMQTEDGREVAERIERMCTEGRYQAALQQMSLLLNLEPDNPHAINKQIYLRRMVDRTRG